MDICHVDAASKPSAGSTDTLILVETVHTPKSRLLSTKLLLSPTGTISK